MISILMVLGVVILTLECCSSSCHMVRQTGVKNLGFSHKKSVFIRLDLEHWRYFIQ
jgi:hypothetical protein